MCSYSGKYAFVLDESLDYGDDYRIYNPSDTPEEVCEDGEQIVGLQDVPKRACELCDDDYAPERTLESIDGPPVTIYEGHIRRFC
uniref:Uncharacterized protein n=1 Tax=Candidatus Kentrum eta TaxID=2126337 RepID=A0A450UIQ1_9GAMM|nr:MAG: hypothetical protein BECKH772A_GA0070896_1002019 [Candidatus Kentron sp. H]VFJ92426.1 MAG: hypothetical protein BECKH772B_GA0070898_1002919 [Candidatus Kentron sp. H]VFJ99032.1 MAG: hypothetical protein BECKH772C_GA0070978_1002818 [Candidatus Kentron sp. H]